MKTCRKKSGCYFFLLLYSLLACACSTKSKSSPTRLPAYDDAVTYFIPENGTHREVRVEGGHRQDFSINSYQEMGKEVPVFVDPESDFGKYQNACHSEINLAVDVPFEQFSSLQLGINVNVSKTPLASRSDLFEIRRPYANQKSAGRYFSTWHSAAFKILKQNLPLTPGPVNLEPLPRSSASRITGKYLPDNTLVFTSEYVSGNLKMCETASVTVDPELQSVESFRANRTSAIPINKSCANAEVVQIFDCRYAGL